MWHKKSRTILLVVILSNLAFLPIQDLFTIHQSLNGEFSNVHLLNDVDIQDIVYTSKDLLIMFKEEIPPLTLNQNVILRKFFNFPVVRIKFPDQIETKSFLEYYSHLIRNVEPIVQAKVSFTEPQVDSTELIENSASIVESTGADKVHQAGYTGKDVKIGIIDTGVSDHSVEFGSRIQERAVFVSEENGYSENITVVTDSWGHGTHVAGLAAGSTTGLAPEAEIYSAKIIHSDFVLGAGNSGGEETTLGMLEAIDYLVNKTVDVINISLGQYHNLAEGLREDVINYVTIHHNIVFCVSAGNSGTIYGDRGSINNPSPALQCITVAAADISGEYLARFSSKGPKPDYSLKPDLAAPGIGIQGPLNKDDGYISKSGTSMASPIVAGAALLLIDFLKTNNIDYNPGTIKAALQLGAKNMGFSGWMQGAGFLNVSEALNILNTSTLVNNTPNIVYLHPEKLPIDPYEVLFQGSSVEFNLTVISSLTKYLNLLIPESLNGIVSSHNTTFEVGNSTLIPISFNIPSDYSLGSYNSSIEIGDTILVIEFEIREPLARILFEESFNLIASHGFTTEVEEIFGDASNTIGMYSSFIHYLSYENNYSVTPHVSGPLSYEFLIDFDVVILANPFSLASDIFMDWVENPGTTYLTIPESSRSALYQYVDNGGGLLILSSDSSYCNLTDFNEFLSNYDLTLVSGFNTGIHTSNIVNNQIWTGQISQIPHHGNFIQTTGIKTSIIAEYDGNPTLASFTHETGGRILLFASDIIFDNIGFSDHAYSGNTEDNKIFAYNAVAWLADGEFREISEPKNNFLTENILIFVSLIAIAALIVFLFGIYKN